MNDLFKFPSSPEGPTSLGTTIKTALLPAWNWVKGWIAWIFGWMRNQLVHFASWVGGKGWGWPVLVLHVLVLAAVSATWDWLRERLSQLFG